MDEIATAIARCAGCVPDSVVTAESIDSGEAEPSIAVAAAKSSSTVEHELRCFRRSRSSPVSTLCEVMRNAVLKETRMPGCASRRRRSLLTFSIGHDPAHNFLLKRACCRSAQVIGITGDPKITFPYLLKICASTLGLCAAPAGSRTATASPARSPRQPRRARLPPSSSASASRSNPRRARCTVVTPPLAISSIGAFRTPAVGARG